MVVILKNRCTGDEWHAALGHIVTRQTISLLHLITCLGQNFRFHMPKSGQWGMEKQL